VKWLFAAIDSSGHRSRGHVLPPQWPDLCAGPRSASVTDRICSDPRRALPARGNSSVAVDICYRRFRFWLTKRLGIAANTSVEDLASAVRNRWEFTGESFDDQVIATMKHCESASSDPFLQASVALRLLQELDGYAARLNLFQGSRKEKGE
jgi:hypothetical protein